MKKAVIFGNRAAISITWMSTGCDRSTDRERAATIALVDSVASLMEVREFAADHVSRARALIGEADSLRSAGNSTMSRERLAQAVVYARLAVVVSEHEERGARIDSVIRDTATGELP